MRVLTVICGEEASSDSEALSSEIREFNAGVDFRLRFLHIEIEEVLVAPAPAGSEDKVGKAVDREIYVVPATDALLASAALALVATREHPEILLAVGTGALLKPAEAAARAAQLKLAFFGHARGEAGDALDLGDDPARAVERLTGVAREIP